MFKKTFFFLACSAQAQLFMSITPEGKHEKIISLSSTSSNEALPVGILFDQGEISKENNEAIFKDIDQIKLKLKIFDVNSKDYEMTQKFLHIFEGRVSEIDIPLDFALSSRQDFQKLLTPEGRYIRIWGDPNHELSQIPEFLKNLLVKPRFWTKLVNIPLAKTKYEQLTKDPHEFFGDVGVQSEEVLSSFLENLSHKDKCVVNLEFTLDLKEVRQEIKRYRTKQGLLHNIKNFISKVLKDTSYDLTIDQGVGRYGSGYPFSSGYLCRKENKIYLGLTRDLWDILIWAERAHLVEICKKYPLINALMDDIGGKLGKDLSLPQGGEEEKIARKLLEGLSSEDEMAGPRLYKVVRSLKDIAGDPASLLRTVHEQNIACFEKLDLKSLESMTKLASPIEQSKNRENSSQVNLAELNELNENLFIQWASLQGSKRFLIRDSSYSPLAKISKGLKLPFKEKEKSYYPRLGLDTL